jgi:hypothetical protein
VALIVGDRTEIAGPAGRGAISPSTMIGRIGPWCGTRSNVTSYSSVIVPRAPTLIVSVQVSIATSSPSNTTQSPPPPSHGTTSSR